MEGMNNTEPGTYTAEDAHRDGRHTSTHPEDRAFFAKVCTLCYDEEVNRQLARIAVAYSNRQCTCGARQYGGCFCNLTPGEFLSSPGERGM